MDKQSITNSSVNSPLNPSPVLPQTKASLLMPVFLTLLVSAVIFGFGGYYIGSTLTDQENSASPSVVDDKSTPIATDNFLKYSNTEYGFSVNYPPNFAIQSMSADVGDMEASSDARNFFIYKIDDQENYLNRYVSFEIFGDAPLLQSEWIKTEVSIGGKSALKYVNSNKNVDFDIYHVSLDKNNGILEIYVSNLEDKIAISNQILSTLRFWGKYVTPDGEYEISYPLWWEVIASPDEEWNRLDGYKDIKITKDDYVIKIQFPSGFSPGVCIFPDNPDYSKSFSDNPRLESSKCSDDYVEMTSPDNISRRRIFQSNLENPDLITWSILTKDGSGYFVGVPPIDYFTPTNFDSVILEEMDQIVSTYKWIGDN